MSDNGMADKKEFDLLRAIDAACAFGTPSGEITREILHETQRLIEERDAARTKLERVRALTETPSFLVHRDFILAVLDV